MLRELNYEAKLEQFRVKRAVRCALPGARADNLKDGSKGPT